MEHEIPKSTSTPSPAPSRSTPARSASTTVCGSAPESRRLFLTGAKPGTKFCSWNESTSYDHPTKQPRAATPGREATPGPTAPAAPASYKDLRPLRWGSRKRQSPVRKGDPWDRLETPVGTLAYSSEAALRSVTHPVPRRLRRAHCQRKARRGCMRDRCYLRLACGAAWLRRCTSVCGHPRLARPYCPLHHLLGHYFGLLACRKLDDPPRLTDTRESALQG